MTRYTNDNTVTEYWVAHWTNSESETTIFFGEMEPSFRITTAMLDIEIFGTEQELIDRVDEIMGVGYYDAHSSDEIDRDEVSLIDLTGYRKSLSCSPWQLRKALNQLGLRDNVETAIASADQDTKDGWEYASSFERLNPLVVSLGIALGKTGSEMDEIFKLAITL